MEGTLGTQHTTKVIILTEFKNAIAKFLLVDNVFIRYHGYWNDYTLCSFMVTLKIYSCNLKSVFNINFVTPYKIDEGKPVLRDQPLKNKATVNIYSYMSIDLSNL